MRKLVKGQRNKLSYRAQRIARAILASSAFTTLIACGGDGASSVPPTITLPSNPAPTPVPTPTPTPAPVVYNQLTIAGTTGSQEIFDPSVEYDGQTGWLSYSTVVPSGSVSANHVHTDLARSDDRGMNWHYIARINESVPAQITETNGNVINGLWRYEVASLVHVPDDTAAPWKLFTHRYLAADDEARLFQYGWIIMQTAPSPSGPWSAEEALFGTSFAPQGGFTTRINIADLDASLADLLVISEPGAIYDGSTLYLTFSGGATGAGIDRIFMLASDDFGANWRYVSTVITNADAAELGAERYDGSSLVKFRGDTYMLATPTSNGKLHNGATVFRFSNLTNGELERENGKLRVFHRIPLQDGRITNFGGGQSDYDEDSLAGVLFPHAKESGPDVFRIYQTGEDILGN